MPGLISVAEFVREARDDQNSPTTSTFLHRIPHCRDTVNRLDEVRRAKYSAVAQQGQQEDISAMLHKCSLLQFG